MQVSTPKNHVRCCFRAELLAKMFSLGTGIVEMVHFLTVPVAAGWTPNQELETLTQGMATAIKRVKAFFRPKFLICVQSDVISSIEIFFFSNGTGGC